MKLIDKGRIMHRTKKKRKAKDSFNDSINGLNTTLVNEDNFKREIICGIIALVLAFALKVSRIEFIIIVLVIAMVLVLELINTAIETTVDLCTSEYHILAKKAKDIAASAVLVMCITSVIVGIIIFVPKIINVLGGL